MDFIQSHVRTFLIWLGLILFWLLQFNVVGTTTYYEEIGNYFYRYEVLNSLGWFLYVVAYAFTLTGCFIWTRLKERHWIFTLWGILSPIGLLGISLLKDKSVIADDRIKSKPLPDLGDK